MDRRDFLKSALTVAAFGSLAHLTGAAEKQGNTDKRSGGSGPQVTRRNYKDSAMTLPLLGFGCMRLPQKSADDREINDESVKEMIDDAMKSGCNYFDTAYMYHSGESERCLGRLLKAYPRESYYLANKMPVWFAKNANEVEAIFKEQLKRCQTDYFDFYMLHALDASNWELAEKFKAYDFLVRMKKEGKIGKLGFSFHDSPEVLQKIVDAKQWDFAQIQLNYLDWELYRSREQYEILTKAGIPVIVMEPLRGGSLATLTPNAVSVLKKSAPDASAAAWGLRYVASLPNVICVLSGMSLPEHMKDNIKTFSPLIPLTNAERETLELAVKEYRRHLAVPCTACRYCMPCPAGVEIPKIFGLYNQYKVTGNKWNFSSTYNVIPEDSRASACVNCGACKKHCPQKIDIPRFLKQIAEEVK